MKAKELSSDMEIYIILNLHGLVLVNTATFLAWTK
jgi:hypothetical protein